MNLATAKLVFCRRLGRSWLDLADAVGVRPDERATFVRGQEARQIWEWLELRDRLPALPTALRRVNRGDLADEIDRHWTAANGAAESSSATDDPARSRRSRFGGPRHRWRGFRARSRRQKWIIGTSLVLVLSLVPGGGLLWRGTTDIRAREDHSRGLTADRTAAPTGSPSPPATRPSRPESTSGSSAERTRAIENMKLRAKAATPHFKNEVVQKLSESVYCYITMIRSLYGERDFVTAEYTYVGSLEGLLRARRPSVLYSTEAFILCDDQDAGATYIRSYRNLYVVLAASGKDPDLLRAGAGVANLEGFEWTGDFRGGLSTLRSLRTGRYVTMDAAAPDKLRGMLRARATEVGEWEKFQITLYSPNRKNWTPPNPLTSEAKTVAETNFGDLLHRMPGARRREDDPTTIDLAPGLEIRLILQTTANVEFHNFRQHCPASSLCVFEHRSLNFAHAASYELIFTDCARKWDLGAIPYPGADFWLDRATSIINNQSDSAYFYDIDTHRFYQPVLSMAPQTVHHDLARGRSQVDYRDLNDRIDGVHVCGPAPTPWVPDRETPVAARLR